MNDQPVELTSLEKTLLRMYGDVVYNTLSAHFASENVSTRGWDAVVLTLADTIIAEAQGNARLHELLSEIVLTVDLNKVVTAAMNND